MATQTKTNPVTESVEAAAERVAELNEKAVANGKKAGAAYLTSYEKAVLSLADTYEKAAGATKVDWLASVGDRAGRLHARGHQGLRPAARGTSSPRRRSAAGPRRLLLLRRGPASSARRTRGRPPAAPGAARAVSRGSARIAATTAGSPSSSWPCRARFCSSCCAAGVSAETSRLRGDRVEDLLGRLAQPALDLREVRVGDADQAGELAHRELLQLALPADVLTQRGARRLVHRPSVRTPPCEVSARSRAPQQRLEDSRRG